MARIRTIKPEFWKDEDLSALPESTHILAAQLLTYSDDEGYFNANPHLIQAEISPLRAPSVSIPESLRKLQVVGYIRLGSTQDGKRYGQIVKFATHQRISHPTPSKISTLELSWEPSGISPELFRNVSALKGKEQGTGKGMDDSAEPAAPAPADSEPVDEFELEPSKPSSPTFITIPTNLYASKREEVAITEAEVVEYLACYPAVDVRQELREMRSWSLARNNQRKTAGGMRKFIASWLAREQDKGGVRPPAPGGRQSDAVFEDADPRGWRKRMEVSTAKGLWSGSWGPKPGETGCHVPQNILNEFQALHPQQQTEKATA